MQLFSEPVVEKFIINWRPKAHHVIILFSDEAGMSFLIPKITTADLSNMFITADDFRMYSFTPPNFVIKSSWEPMTVISGGQWFPLSVDPSVLYNSLMEILDETACN